MTTSVDDTSASARPTNPAPVVPPQADRSRITQREVDRILARLRAERAQRESSSEEPDVPDA